MLYISALILQNQTGLIFSYIIFHWWDKNRDWHKTEDHTRNASVSQGTQDLIAMKFYLLKTHATD